MHEEELREMLGESFSKINLLLSKKEQKQFEEAASKRGGVKFFQRFGVNKNTAYLYLSGRRNTPLRLYIEVLGKVPKRMTLKMNRNLSKSILLPDRLNGDIAYMAGALRDGWLIRHGKRIVGIGLEQADADWLCRIERLIWKNFAIKAKISNTTLIAYSELLGRYFHHFLEMPLEGQETWRVPTAIRYGPMALKKAFIEGFLDAEGYIKDKKGDAQVALYQNSAAMLQDVKQILGEFGIITGSIRSDKRSRNHCLNICEKKSLRKFSRIFKPRLERKKLKLRNLAVVLR